jgi:competence protein ComEC
MLIEAIDDARIPPRSRVSWFDPPRMPDIGDIWELEVRLRRPRGNSNPGLFSVEDWMFRENLPASGYIVSGSRNQLLAQGVLPAVDAYRRDFVRRSAGPGGTAQPVLAAIAVGARHRLSRADWDRYARTGTSHLMAISGLHIGLAAAAAFGVYVLLSGACRIRGNHLDQATIAGLAMAAIYAGVSGFAVPSQRATIMLMLAAVAMLSRRRPVPGRIVALAALGIFIVDPVSSMAPGFKLSFAAVILLLASAGIYARSWQGPAAIFKPVTIVRQLVRMQLLLLLGLMPLTILCFQRVTLLAPVANLMAVPIFSIVTVPLALASMVVDPLWRAAGAVLMQLSAASITVIEGLIAWLAKLPLADTLVAGINGFDSAIMCIIFLPAVWAILPRGWPGRWIAMLAVIFLLLYRPASPPRGCIEAHVLDVGQGLAVVVQGRQTTLVFDTGASYRDGGSAAEQIVLPFLRYRGITRVDWLIASHADNDHAGGVAAMVRDIGVGQILAGEPLADLGRTVQICRDGQSWQADGVAFEILHPPADAGFVGNDASCVLAVVAGQHRLVLTGDIERAAEKSLLAREALTRASVVLIPHHGSLTSSSPPFVNRLQPDYAIVSAAHANRWGFPKERVTRRWQGSGARVLNTASSGAISFRMCREGGISRLGQERLRRQRFWHDSPLQ